MSIKLILTFLLTILNFRCHDNGYMPEDMKAPSNGKFLSDPLSILPIEDFATINATLQSFTDFEVWVLIIPQISASFLNEENDKNNATYQFAQTVFNNWKFEKAINSSGLLIFISSLERKMEIVLDKEVNRFITESDLDEIYKAGNISLQNQEYRVCLTKTLEIIKNISTPPNFLMRIYNDGISDVVFVLFMTFMCYVLRVLFK